MIGQTKRKTFYKYVFLILIVLGLIAIYKFFDVNQINIMIEDIDINQHHFNYMATILIFFLRFISIIIPILPGTYCSILAGYLFGIKTGFVIIFLADFFSCSSSFLISRKLGRDFVNTLLGKRQIERIERISKNLLEKNFFLMTGLLMTQFFDFVCYAVGLTNVSWKKFMPALLFSICISDIPFVAGGYSIREIKSLDIQQIVNGEVQALQGPYLTIFILSVIMIFGLAFLNFISKTGT